MNLIFISAKIKTTRLLLKVSEHLKGPKFIKRYLSKIILNNIANITAYVLKNNIFDDEEEKEILESVLVKLNLIEKYLEERKSE